MALAQFENSAPLSTELLGNAFVEQYYLLLHDDIEQIHRFYKDSSILSRPGTDGKMTAVTTVQRINDEILSMDYSNCEVEILTVDSQASYRDGLIVLVTGILTKKDSMGRKFVQTFFLGPQETGYFVMNDMLQFVEDILSSDVGEEDVAKVVVDVPCEPTELADHNVVDKDSSPKNDADKKDKVSLPSAKEETEKEVAVVGDNDGAPVNSAEIPPDETLVSAGKENTPKKSYVSISGQVHELKRNFASFNVKASLTKAPAFAPTQASEALASGTKNSEKNHDNEDKAYTIYVGGLPMTTTSNQLRKVFTRFGPIQPNGVNVRCNMRHCFGFVDFGSSSSLEEALKATDVLVGGYKVTIEVAKKNKDNNRHRNSDRRGLPGPSRRSPPVPGKRSPPKSDEMFQIYNYRRPMNFRDHFIRGEFKRQPKF